MKCFSFNNPNHSCTQWQFNLKEMSRTIITEFNLVCNRAYLSPLTQSFYMYGYLISGLLFGYISDKYGRRLMIFISISIEIFALSYSALSPNITNYLFSRLLIGIGSCGRTCAMRALLVECCGPKYRSDIITCSGLGWIVGYISLPLVAYILRDYKSMNWFSVFLFTVMLICFYFLWESPRWLITNGQLDKAKDVLLQALKLNNKNIENFDQTFKQLIENLEKSQKQDLQIIAQANQANLLDLIKTPKMRVYSLILCYASVVMALVYYGFSFNISNFGGNIHITFILSGLVELPGLLLTVFLLRYLGRRRSFYGFFLMTSLFSLAVIPFEEKSWLKVMFALLAKFSISTAWCVSDVFSPEIFPTVLRNSGLAVLLTIGRIGSSSAPFMKNFAENYSLSVVMIFYAIITGLVAILGVFLPETRDQELPDSLEQVKNSQRQTPVLQLNIIKI